MKHKSKKNKPTRTGEDTAGRFLKQVQVPYTPTTPIGFGAQIFPITPSSTHPTSDLTSEYEQLFQNLSNLQGTPDPSSFYDINQYAQYLLSYINDTTNKPGSQAITRPQRPEEPEEPRNPSSWQDFLDDIEDTDDETRRRPIIDIVPTTTDPLDILDDIPDASDDTGSTPGGEPDNIHDDDEPPASDTQIKDKLPTGIPSCEEIEDYLSSLGIQASICTRFSKETRIIGKA